MPEALHEFAARWLSPAPHANVVQATVNREDRGRHANEQQLRKTSLDASLGTLQSVRAETPPSLARSRSWMAAWTRGHA